MSHERYKDWLRLAVANEISTDDMRLLRVHLGECDSCRTEFQELRQMMTTLMERGVTESSEEMLWEARRNLQSALEKENSVSSISTRVTQSVASQVSQGSPRFNTSWLAGLPFCITTLYALILINYCYILEQFPTHHTALNILCSHALPIPRVHPLL